MPFYVPQTSSFYKLFLYKLMRNLNFYDISDFEFNIRIAMVVGSTNSYDLLFQILSLYYISMKQCNIFFFLKFCLYI